MLSNIGNWMENVGQSWVVASQTHSAFHVELLSFAQFLPVIFLALPAGVLADKYNRKTVLLSAQLAMCLFATTLAILAHLGYASPTLVICITFLEGAAWAFNGPAWYTVVPNLVPRKDLTSAIALNSIQFNIARLVGPAIAGLIVAHFGFAYAFDLNALSFLAVIFAILFVKIDFQKDDAKNSKTQPITFYQAWKWVWEHKGTKRLVISIALFALLSAPLQGLMPYFASDILKTGPQGLGTLLACLGGGAITGAFLLGYVPADYPFSKLIPWAFIILGAFMLIYSQSPWLALTYPILYLAGIFWLCIMISTNTAMQLLIPDKIRGRAMSILIMAHVGVLPFGHMLGGILAKHIGPRDTTLLDSICLLIVGFYTLIKKRPEMDGIRTPVLDPPISH